MGKKKLLHYEGELGDTLGNNNTIISSQGHTCLYYELFMNDFIFARKGLASEFTKFKYSGLCGKYNPVVGKEGGWVWQHMIPPPPFPNTPKKYDISCEQLFGQ